MHELLPCTYGYATTIRRAQGASLDYVCLYSDYWKAPDRGYGYVGANRCRNAAGLFYFKRLRRTDWLPVGGGHPDEQPERGDASDAESIDPDDGWCGDASHNSSMRSRSEGYVSSDDHMSQPAYNEDGFAIDENGYPIDEDGFHIIEDLAIVGDGDFTFEGEPEPLDTYADLTGGRVAKRRKVAE